MPPSLEEDGERYPGANSIVVKGEYWSHPSSPESMSSEIEPLVANLLQQMHSNPRHLESPEPLDRQPTTTTNQIPDATNTRSDQGSARGPRSKTAQKVIVMTSEDRLLLLPEKRLLPWREGVEAGADIETGGDSRRKQIRFGCLLATRGEIQNPACISCQNGRGKFAVCVALDGFFKGACASCQLSGQPNRCSIKKEEDGTPIVTPAKRSRKPKSERQPLSNGQTRPQSPPRPLPSTLQSEEQPQQQTQVQPQPSSDGPRAKRRRTGTAPVVPDWESARPQWEQELGDSQARQQMNEAIQMPWATVNPPVPTPNMQPMLNGMAVLNGVNGIRGTAQYPEHRNSLSWATVNQPVQQPTHFQNGGDSSGGGFRNNLDQGKREDTVLNEDGSLALIDTLPKNKQRLVYGLVSGLQGGIQNLQRELDSLKKALGIDDEDD